MVLELNEKEMSLLQFLIDQRLGWAIYKTKHTKVPDDEKKTLLDEIETLNSLIEKMNEDK